MYFMIWEVIIKDSFSFGSFIRIGCRRIIWLTMTRTSLRELGLDRAEELEMELVLVLAQLGLGSALVPE